MSYSINTSVYDFEFTDGKFYAMPSHVERVETSSLRDMFLPKISPEGHEAMGAKPGGHFILGQLRHYGVKFEESQFTGSGHLLMKRTLREGKCDRVPKRITDLRERLLTKWFSERTLEDLADHPEWVLERFFLSNGRPDHTKTDFVIALPIPPAKASRVRQRSVLMDEAVSQVEGLYHISARGVIDDTVFIGWNAADVVKAAEDHPAKEAKELRAAATKRARLPVGLTDAEAHKAGSKAATTKVFSPVGSYVVQCRDMDGERGGEGKDMTFDIRRSKIPQFLEGSFDFDIVEGAILMSTEDSVLNQYCSEGYNAESDFNDSDKNEDENDGDDNSEDAEEEEEEEYADADGDASDDNEEIATFTIGSKRKAESDSINERPNKKPNNTVVDLRVYHLRLKGHEIGEGQIFSHPERGIIQFREDTFSRFAATIGVPGYGPGIHLTALKVSTTPAPPRRSWASYSEAAYELERRNRWR